MTDMRDESRRPDDSPAAGVAPDRSESGRRVYVAPELVEYGTVSKLTQSGGGSLSDGGAMRRMGACL